MPDYDFNRLSHVDFEELVHDLLESDWGCRLEAFKTGRDDGIDLRYIACDGSRTIVQCKHYPNTSISTLISKLRNDELPKIRALAPQRYVLVTSAGLTPQNKTALFELLQPFVLREEDIIGATEVEARLRQNDDLVKSHYKLWLTSTAVMSRVLHAAEHARTDIHLEKILRKLPLFVRHEAFPRALNALDDHRIVVISGGPGIGKSTLADMLLYSHVEGGFTPAVITDNLAEAHVLTRPGKKMLFYFDDFWEKPISAIVRIIWVEKKTKLWLISLILLFIPTTTVLFSPPASTSCRSRWSNRKNLGIAELLSRNV